VKLLGTPETPPWEYDWCPGVCSLLYITAAPRACDVAVQQWG